jgi:signal transduction histidine kinase
MNSILENLKQLGDLLSGRSALYIFVGNILVSLWFWKKASRLQKEKDKLTSRVEKLEIYRSHVHSLNHDHRKWVDNLIDKQNQLVLSIKAFFVSFMNHQITDVILSDMVLKLVDQLSSDQRLLIDEVWSPTIALCEAKIDSPSVGILTLHVGEIGYRTMLDFEKFSQVPEGSSKGVSPVGEISVALKNAGKFINNQIETKSDSGVTLIFSMKLVGDAQTIKVNRYFFKGMCNALGNSHKYANSVSGAVRITIVVDVQKGLLIGEVSDNGFGMTKEKQDQLYKKKVRMSETGGSGTGSYEVARLIRAAGGSIDVTKNVVRRTVETPFTGVTTLITMPFEHVVESAGNQGSDNSIAVDDQTSSVVPEFKKAQ